MLRNLLKLIQSSVKNSAEPKKSDNVLRSKIDLHLKEIGPIIQQLEHIALFEKANFKKINTLCKIATDNYNRLLAIRSATSNVDILEGSPAYVKHIDEIKKIVKTVRNINIFINGPVGKKDPLIIANVEGLYTGNYIAPSLFKMGIFAIKQHHSEELLNELQNEYMLPKLTE